MRAKTLIATAPPVAATVVAGGPAESVWYGSLRKPSYQPPRQAFPITWTVLYGDVAVSSVPATR